MANGRLFEADPVAPLDRVRNLGVRTVYLSSRFARRAELAQYRRVLEADPGWLCTARWLDSGGTIDELGRNVVGGVLVEAEASTARAFADEDLRDVARAEVFLAFADPVGGAPGSGRGGRHVELGYALALCPVVALVGPREHVFHYHARVQWVGDDWSAALAWLRGGAGR